MTSLREDAGKARAAATASPLGRRFSLPRARLHLRRQSREDARVVQTSPTHLGLRRNFLWTASGFAIYAFMQWAVIITLAKGGDPTSVGAFTLATAITSPIVLFTNLQLKALQASDAQSDFQFPDYVSLRVATSSIAFLLIGAFALLAGYTRYVAGVIVVVGAAKCIESFSDVLYGLFQKHERFDRISTSLIIRSSTSLVAVVVVMAATGSVLLVCLTVAIIWFLALVVYDVDRAKRLLASRMDLNRYATIREWVPFVKPRMQALAKLAFPMGIVMLLIALNLNIPRLVIERDLGIRQLGYFGAMAYPVFAGSLAVFALGEATIPRLSREFLGAPRQFVRVWCRLLLTASLIGVAGVVIVAIWGSDLLRVLYGPGYEQYATAFTWLVIGAGFSYVGSANSYALTAARRLKIQVPLFAIVTAATLVGALVLVPRNGLVGAGQVTVITGVIHAALAGGALAIAVVRRRKAVTPDPAQSGSPSGALESLSGESLYEA